MVPLKASMPRRSASSSTGYGSVYMVEMCSSSGMGCMALGRPPSWSIMPTLARSSGSACSGFSPSRRTVPRVGLSRPWAQARVVVLPAPLAPSRTTTSPGKTRRLTLLTSPLAVSRSGYLVRKAREGLNSLMRSLMVSAGSSATMRRRAVGEAPGSVWCSAYAVGAADARPGWSCWPAVVVSIDSHFRFFR